MASEHGEVESKAGDEAAPLPKLTALIQLVDCSAFTADGVAFLERLHTCLAVPIPDHGRTRVLILMGVQQQSTSVEEEPVVGISPAAATQLRRHARASGSTWECHQLPGSTVAGSTGTWVCTELRRGDGSVLGAWRWRLTMVLRLTEHMTSLQMCLSHMQQNSTVVRSLSLLLIDPSITIDGSDARSHLNITTFLDNVTLCPDALGVMLGNVSATRLIPHLKLRRADAHKAHLITRSNAQKQQSQAAPLVICSANASLWRLRATTAATVLPPMRGVPVLNLFVVPCVRLSQLAQGRKPPPAVSAGAPVGETATSSPVVDA